MCKEVNKKFTREESLKITQRSMQIFKETYNQYKF